MKCPYCGYKNIAGSDECESCHEDLASLDGVVPHSKVEKVLMTDPLSRLKPRKPIFVSKTTSVLDTIKIMSAEKIGCVLVGDETHLEGILTERDITLKAPQLNIELSKIPVESLMTATPESLSEEDTLALAINKMDVGGFRHIPILRDDHPVGIISIRDVLGYLSNLFS